MPAVKIKVLSAIRIDLLLQQHFPELSRNNIQSLIKNNKVAVEGFVSALGLIQEQMLFITKPSTIIYPSLITLNLNFTEDILRPEFAQSDLDIIYEDAHLAVINKPSGLVVHHGHAHKGDTLADMLLAIYGEQGLSSERSEEGKAGIVHRLDKDTSGLMLIAKDNFTHLGLAKQLANHSCYRLYKALIHKNLEPQEGTINLPISRSTNYKRMVINGGGKHAVTHYKTLAIFNKKSANSNHNLPLASLIECQLETGRTHQIRIHTAHLGCSVIGDQMYSSKGAVTALTQSRLTQSDRAYAVMAKFPRQALHAYQIKFTHPVSQSEMSFTCPPPADFIELYRQLKNHCEIKII